MDAQTPMHVIITLFIGMMMDLANYLFVLDPDSTSCNYDESAEIHNVCEYECQGCTDADSQNYILKFIDDG